MAPRQRVCTVQLCKWTRPQDSSQMRRGAHQKVAPPKRRTLGCLLVHRAHPRPKTVSKSLSQSVRVHVPSSQTPYAAGTSTPWASASVDASSPCGHAITVRNSGDAPHPPTLPPPPPKTRPRHWQIHRAEEVTPASGRPTTIIIAVNAVM
ncbi:hypothetical protein TraAM80_03587 [Trypanosoma rangeli]|uniref:Uncharacterized protein n=1 Tax=Trypanosoma rangeli TaxID=5698 RepID=A0A422NNL1_TRYRA|nr:uncharacterized protein TraAM80_03587 [Trypanosoma rangeli]RNF07100.1 hypothetical protein TraAM80_03587 [Trypanosoma rangeli]|eukprot:RNF07100.1 hypothetical protein TraAM80_03587 [Trypanosoma rangeli]